MIDLHNHLLPNIDDGSRSVEQSVGVLEAFAAEGVTTVVLTPHLKATEIVHGGEERLAERAQAFERLKAQAPAAPELKLGFEIMLDDRLPTLAMGDRRFSLAGSRYYLVEFLPSVVGPFATNVLHQIAAAGVVPLVAHPERYDACSPDVVQDWRNAGAKMQVDATTLTRATTRGERARALVELGLADIVAADNHGDRRTVATAATYLTAHGLDVQAEWLTLHNPKAILEDRDLMPVPSGRLRGGALGWFRRLLK